MNHGKARATPRHKTRTVNLWGMFVGPDDPSIYGAIAHPDMLAWAGLLPDRTWIGPPMSMAEAAELLGAPSGDALRKRIARARPRDPLFLFRRDGPGRYGRMLAADAVDWLARQLRLRAEAERDAIEARAAEIRESKAGVSRRRDLQVLDHFA